MKKVLFVLLLASFAQAAETTSTLETEGRLTTKVSNRLAKKTGITTGFGSPFPSLLGLNVNYNVKDWLRANVGYGEISVSTFDSSAKVTTLGAGADALVPGWNLSPIAGLRVSKVDVSSSGGASVSVQGVEESTTLLYAQAGLDWQAQGGFNIGAGQVVGLSGGEASGSYLNLGWYF